MQAISSSEETKSIRIGADPIPKMGFSQIRGTFLGVPIIRTIVYLGLYGGPLILGKYQIA